MTQTIAHFVFTVSGGGCLLQALRKAGRKDLVVATCHDMDLGPIDPSDPSLRAKWLEDELGRIDRKDGARSERDWDEARFPGHRKVAWLTRQSATEYAGFLDWLWHRGDTPCDLVDLSEVKISHPPESAPSRSWAFPMSLAYLHGDIIAHNKLWDLAEPLPMAERLRYREIWERLISENAPLRVIDGNKLVSAPTSYFDSALMSRVTDKWQKVAMVLSWVAISYWDDGISQTNDTFLAARLRALVADGRLEIRGETARDIVFGEVRLASARGLSARSGPQQTELPRHAGRRGNHRNRTGRVR
jgi:hypothetical protein